MNRNKYEKVVSSFSPNSRPSYLLPPPPPFFFLFAFSYLPSGWLVTDSQVSLEASRMIVTSELHLAGTGMNAKWSFSWFAFRLSLSAALLLSPIKIKRLVLEREGDKGGKPRRDTRTRRAEHRIDRLRNCALGILPPSHLPPPPILSLMLFLYPFIYQNDKKRGGKAKKGCPGKYLAQRT